MLDPEIIIIPQRKENLFRNKFFLRKVIFICNTMEKITSTPLRNSENECGRALTEKNSVIQTKPEVVEEIIYQKITEKNKQPAQIVDNKNIKIKKLKVKKCRGEKRKFPDKLDSKKNKRKKKEEKSGVSARISVNKVTEEIQEIEVLHIDDSMSPINNLQSAFKKEYSTAGANESDVENSDRSVKQKSSRKSKAIANKCKETLDVLIKLGLEVLDSMDKSLKVIKSHSLLNSKYISVDILLDLISLALKLNKRPEIVDSEKESSLSMIITKGTEELCSTPVMSKARQSLSAVHVTPQNKSLAQEKGSPSIPISKEILENQTPKDRVLEEIMQPYETYDISSPEKTQEPAKSGKNLCITNYFKKLKKIVEEKDKNERFSCFTAKTDMFLAPKVGGELTGERRQKFEQEFKNQNFEFNYLTEQIIKHKFNKKSKNPKPKNKFLYSAENAKESSSHDVIEEIVKESSLDETAETSEVNKSDSIMPKRAFLIRVENPKIEPVETVCRAKAKLFQFHENRRPPYWGTWRRKSECVGPRKPFGRDKMFNYEIDSEDEWEEEEEPGESLHGSDDEKEPEEDYEVDNEFFVPHGYLSDDENPEKENLSPKTKLNLLEEQFTSEQKQKMRKMTPIVLGTFWVHKGIPSEGNLYQDLQIDKLQYVPWTKIPVEIEGERKKSDNASDQGEHASQIKKSKQKIFPNEEIPNLIKMIHGSPQNADHLAKKFLLYWETEKIPDGNRPGLTKVCVQKKIKELASWQASQEKGKMCWQVPKETREEFGAEVENKTPEKKPQKCFIWKFVRKADKNPGAGKPAPAEVEPEVVTLES